MSLENKRIIITGAAGGLGSHVAKLLSAQGAKLILVDLDHSALKNTLQNLDTDSTITISTDITLASGRNEIVKTTLNTFQGIDILINLAGINPFGSFTKQESEVIQKTMEVNTIAPMLLTHDVLPTMHKQHSGQIVNIGSIFGSIAFAWFTSYSTSKFALRGFSQSLRRELADTGIDVTYIAPRAIKTSINSAAVYEMAEVIKMNMDEPEEVAEKVIHAIETRKKEYYIGFPESLFVRINAILPGLVDNVVRKQNRLARPYALREEATD